MLNIRPPDRPARSWKDFFVQIATISIGLLIAISLENLAERVHKHLELVSTRESLVKEREANYKSFEVNARNWRWEMAGLQNDLLVLNYVRTHPGQTRASLPGVMNWVQYPVVTNVAAWQSARQRGITALMPLDEANANEALYHSLEILQQQSLDTWNALNDAKRFEYGDPDPTHLSPQQVTETIRLVEIAIEKHVQVGDSIALIGETFKDFPPSLTFDEIGKIIRQGQPAATEDLTAVRKLTLDRMRAAGYEP